MFLTTELLERYHAPREVVEKFRVKYPNGIDTILFLDENQKKLNNKNFRENLFWGYMMLPLTDAEKEKYQEVLEIDTSEVVSDGWKIFYSRIIAKSRNITNCQFVYNSDGIFNCRHILESNGVNRSEFLDKSNKITNSFYTSESTKVQDSARVLRSWEITDGRDIINSRNIQHSSSLCQCQDCHDVWYSNLLVNCHHCLFCHNFQNKSFMIFNTQFTERDFFIVASLVQEYEFFLEPVMKAELLENSFAGFRPVIISSIFDHYSKMTQKDFDFLYSLPHYNAWVVYQITMNNKAFQDLKNS